MARRNFRVVAFVATLFVCGLAESSAGAQTSKRSPKEPPGERQLKASSVDAKFDLSENLRGTNEDNLLQQSGNKSLGGGRAQVEQTVLPDGTKVKKSNLPIGVFRTQDIAQGYVAPPGVADFAAYLRSSSSPRTTFVRPGSMPAEEFQRQVEAEKLRAQTNASIRQILASKPPKEQKLDLLIRLAEIQIERHAFYQEQEIRTFNEAHDGWEKNGRKGSEPVFSTVASQRQLSEGVSALRIVVTEYPTHQRTPEALFTLGFLLTQIRSDSAEFYFKRLVESFPKSEQVPDAWLALGEYYFSKTRFDKALSSYQKVINYKAANPRAYHFAVYKLGWTFFNLRNGSPADIRKNLEKSLAAFKLIVRLADSSKEDKNLPDLRRDSLRDMVLVFVDLGDIAGAEKYFEGLGERELYLTMLERLGWQYAENGEYQHAIDVYLKLIAEASEHKRLPAFYAKVPDLYERLLQTDKTLIHLRLMAENLSSASPWGKKYYQNADILEEKDRILSKELRGWSERFHADAQKRNSEKRFDNALSAYQLYLEYFGQKPESYHAHFFSAEILVRREKYLEASDGYMTAVEMDEKFSLKNKRTADALVNAVASLDRALEKVPTPRLPEAGTVKQPIPLPLMNGKLVKALDSFVRLYPSDSQVLEFSHRAAKTVYAFGDYLGARKRWMTLAARFPKSDEVRDGLRFVLKVHVHRKDWDSGISDSRAFLAIHGVRESKLAVDLIAVLKASVFSKALALEVQNNRSAAGDLFLAYHKEFQQDVDAPKALFNAANNRFKQGRIDEAISILQTLLAQYPKSNLSSNAMYMIASANDSLGRFSESAASYEHFARENPSDAVAPDVLLRAAEERLATGEMGAAMQDVLDYQAMYPKHASIVRSWILLGRMHQKSRKLSEASKAFLVGAELSFRQNQPLTSIHMYGLAADVAWQSGEKSHAIQAATTGAGLWARLPESGKSGVALEGIRLIARVKFASVDEKISTLYSRSISNGGEIVEQFAKIKAEAAVFEKKYAEIVKLGNAESGVASLYRVAEIREFLSSILLKAPHPSGADAEGVEQFRAEVEKIAIPMGEEASKLYFAAWQKGNETEAITPFQHKLYEKLAVLRPADFRPVVGEMPVPSYYSSGLVFLPETAGLVRK